LNPSDYEYRGLLAETWDLFRGDTSRWPDRPFYLSLIRRFGEPALDVGCATGRLLLDYLAQGVDIEGVDLSPEMLDLCRRKADALGLSPTLYQQAVEELDLPRRYRTILVPSSSFQLVTDPGRAREAMRRLYEHLEPGGALVMPFMVLWREGDALEHAEWQKTAEQERPEDGLVARRWSRTRYDPAEQLEHTEDRFELVRDGEIVASEQHERSPATRWYTQEQARRLYEDAGFVDVELLHEFTDGPARPDDWVFTVVGRRPG
jgi:ubiquinone/menaquinone biosynthesis C-methylase UbiE